MVFTQCTTSQIRAIDDGCYVGAVFLDLRNTVDHEILLRLSIDSTSDLVQVSSWLRKQKIHLNAIKCCVVLFGSRPALSQSPRLCVTLDGNTLLQMVKYLGVVFDSHLSWNEHIEGLRSKINRIVKMLCRLHQFVPPKAVQSYSSLVLPALDYCDVVWDGCSKMAQANLEIVHNNAARAIMGGTLQIISHKPEKPVGLVNLGPKERKSHCCMDVPLCQRICSLIPPKYICTKF